MLSAAPAPAGRLPDRADARPVVVCIAGFGDTGAMFAPLLGTSAARHVRFHPLDLPGFGAPALERTSLAGLAGFLRERCAALGARTLVAHSVASIIASLAARAAREGGAPRIERIVSLEGNLTADDAYFSGTAAEHDDPRAFRSAFLARLDDLIAKGGPHADILAGYRARVAGADPVALWSLGRDAFRFGARHVPGDVLREAATATYLYNPDNCAAASLDWLAGDDLDRVILDGASHWPTLDRPEEVASLIARIAVSR